MIRALLALAVLATPAAADRDQPPKKDRARLGKTTNTAALPAVGRKPEKLVNLRNQWTDEWLAIAPGEQVPPATADRFLRDHYTSEHIAMEPALLGFVLAAADHFRSDTAFVVSAFRHPKYNLILRKKGHQVARDSQHTHGTAVDFFLPRVTTKALHAWAKTRRAGGVGLYLDSGFIHMDTGPVRYWNGE